MSSEITARSEVGKDTGFCIYTSGAAWLVLTMCSPWKVDARDSYLLQYNVYEQWRVDAESFRAANDQIPWTLEGYFAWTKKEFPEVSDLYRKASYGRAIDQEMFDTARSFVRDCALNNYWAHFSP